MPPKLEDFTLPEVQDLLSFALGQAPSSAIPPGCSTLFLSLYNFFKEHTAEANFAAVQTLVYRSAMRFITTYRPMAELSSFIDTVNTCRCRQSPALMRRIPKQLHDRCLARYTSLESRSLLVFIEYACRDMCRAVVVAGPSTLYRAQRRTRFPTCPEDLLPGDRNACMAMLVGWLIVPFGAPMQGLSRLVCQVLKTFRSAVLPAVLNSPAIREWTFNAGRLSRLMARRDSPHAVDINTTEIHRITGFVRDSGNLLQTLSDLCFDDELMFWAARDDPRFVGLFGTLGDSAPRAVHLLTTLARERGVQISQEDLTDMRTGVRAWTTFCGRLFPFYTSKIPSDPDTTPAMRAALMEWRDRPRDIDYVVLDCGFGPQWRHRCFAPACMRTCVSEGRRFRVCAKCKVATYCSPECQARSWKHKHVPHWRLCKDLRRIRPVIKGCGNEAERYAALRREVDRECVLDACRRLHALQGAKFNNMRECCLISA
jgi:hypothetical protein